MIAIIYVIVNDWL
ncbi:hypothetical protein EC951288_3483A, partial [Escherichia coli 95.1288]